MDVLRSLIRKQAGRQESPSLGIIDSRSVKASHHVDSDRGTDGNKKIKGRKEHIIVDTLGLPLAVAIHEANLHDNKGAHKPLKNSLTNFRVWLKSWLWEALGEIWPIGSRRNTDGYWRSYSALTNVHPNFRYSPNAGLWNALSYGWKISED